MHEAGKGLELQLRIKRLMRQHRVETSFEQLHLVPMVAAANGAQILEGIASTPDIDLQRTKIRPYCFGWPLPNYCKAVPLLYKHDPKQIAGRLEDLAYDDRGGLLVRAHVHHERARRCQAFSIAATVRDYELVNPDNRDTFHALINSARLDEISLTDIPANPRALVTQRSKPGAQAQFYDHMLQLASGLQRAVALMQTGART